MMRKVIIGFCAFLGMAAISSCQESLQERAAREAKEFTEKYCPTPPRDNAITDSVTFDTKTNTRWEYYTLVGEYDNPDAIAPHADELKQNLLEAIINSTGEQPYKDAGFSFGYIIRSKSHPDITILNVVFGPKDYNTTPKKK